VLIPRPDTELLVELAMERLPQDAALLDMGTGSGRLPSPSPIRGPMQW
jgi:release factor glutamine methyltransferase